MKGYNVSSTMAAQQIQFAETIRAMKVALKRRRAASPAPSTDDSADDSDGLHTHTNRGHKLQPSARYVKTGRLDITGGQPAYKCKINHAGYERSIISRKRKLYDEDGDVVDPAEFPSEVEEEDMRTYGEPIEEDPFASVKLEKLLRPLTSAAELPTHPSLSHAYTNTALTKMVNEAAEMVRKEREHLWRAKRLFMRFRGDGGWMNLEKFETANDEQFLIRESGEENVWSQSAVPSIVETELPMQMEGMTTAAEGVPRPQMETEGSRDVIGGIDAQNHLTETEKLSVDAPDTSAAAPHGQASSADQRHAALPNGTNSYAAEIQAPNHTVTELANQDRDDDDNTSSSAPTHAMTTRARARSPQLPASPSPSPSDSASVPLVNPWFLTPFTALPDRDLGLPARDADDTRQLLLHYIQKQENIIRQLEELYNGLHRADRLRNFIYRSCKAEGHMVPDGKGGMMTEMSDGEDWYDPEEWGLEADELKDGQLEKGKDEVDLDLVEDEGRRIPGRRRGGRYVGKG